MKSLFAVLACLLLGAPAAEARHSHNTQSCVFKKGGVLYKTDRHHAGELFYFKDASEEHATLAQYVNLGADAHPSDRKATATVTILASSDGTSVTQSDGCSVTTRHKRLERVLVRYFSAAARTESTLPLGEGEELVLHCEVESEEPARNPAEGC